MEQTRGKTGRGVGGGGGGGGVRLACVCMVRDDVGTEEDDKLDETDDGC